MPLSRKKQIIQCDRRIEQAGDLVDAKQPQRAITILLKIEKENWDLIQSSPYLIAGLNIELGMAYYHLAKPTGRNSSRFLEEAIKHFSIMLNIKEASENILFMRAKCYDYLSMAKEAEADYRRVIELNPKADYAHDFLGLLMENEGHRDEAIGLYREALRQNPTDEATRERMENLIRGLQEKRALSD